MHEDFTPTEGADVLYQIAEGEFRPAKIVRVWTITHTKTCNLVVFIDGSNDARFPHAGGRAPETLAACPVVWKTSVYMGDQVGQYLPLLPDRS